MQLKEHSSSKSPLKGLSPLSLWIEAATAMAREWGFKYRRGKRKKGEAAALSKGLVCRRSREACAMGFQNSNCEVIDEHK